MAKPKLALVPAAQGSKFYSVLPSSGVGDFDFTRSGSATRINSQGLIETVTSGVSRLNYPLIDGVVNGCPSHILEPSRLQKIQYSEDFSQWNANNLTVIDNNTISPSGNLNASKLTENSSTSSHQILSNSMSTVNGLTYTFSVFLKNNGVDNVSITAGNFGNLQMNSTFDLVNGLSNSQSGSSSIKKIGDYYLCTLTGYSNATRNQSMVIVLNRYNLSSPFSYTGDGVSGVYIWGAQFEQGSYPTSYIPNYGTSAGITRTAETANGSGDADTFNDSEGVLFAEISAFENLRLGISENSSTANRVLLGQNPNGDVFSLVTVGSSPIYTYSASGFSLNENIKVALKYKESDFALWVNGIEVDNQQSGTTFSSDTLNVLDFTGQGADFYGNTKQLQYFDTALTDAELEKLTSYDSFRDMAIAGQYKTY